MSHRIALLGCFLSVLGSSQAIPNPNATSAIYTTKVVTALTTYCPGPTTITHNDKTYTITSATTLTITDCPCIITEPHPKPTEHPGECEWLCKQSYNECIGTKPNNRNCVLEEDSCKAACPSHSDVKPTPKPTNPTESRKPAPKPTGHPGECEWLCKQSYNECIGTKPNSRNCILEEDSCKAACPDASSIPAPKPTNPTESRKLAPKPTEHPGECEWLCEQSYNECIGTKPNSRNCVLEEDSCKAACPGASSIPAPKPTNPTLTTQPVPKPTEDKDTCISQCSKSYDECVGSKPSDRNCIIEQDGCKATCGEPIPTPVPVNNAGQVAANMLLALGAAAALI